MANGRFDTLTLGTNLTGTDQGDGELLIDASGGTFDPATATSWWFPLVDADGTCVLDVGDDLIPTLLPM